MRIDHLVIQNFKCFAEFEMSLEPGVNIIYGVNGVGKTSILEALSVAAGSFFDDLSEVQSKRAQRKEIRLETRIGKLEYQFPMTLVFRGVALGENFSDTEKYTRKENTPERIEFIEYEGYSYLSVLSEKASKIVQNGVESPLPVIAYFSCRRLFNENGNGQSTKPIGRFLGYYNALNDRSIREEVDNWLNDEATKRYNSQRHGAPQDPYQSLELIEKTLLGIFPGKYKEVYYYKPESDDRLTSGLFFLDDAGTITSLQMMSDGYRNTVNLVLEIAWRCVQLNAFLGPKTLTETEGIVMIDEIDLHLHPTLQQRIVGLLKDTFPRIQFVMTTHSPLVLGSAESTAWKLEDGKLIQQPQLFGKDANYIIRHFMGATDRSPEINTLIKEYFALINQQKGRGTEALAMRAKLEEIDPNLIAEADVLIRFLED